MGDLSKNFSRSEWLCKCGCGLDTVDAELINSILQPMRDHFKRKVTVTRNGGCRCYLHNIACGGSKKSQHIECKAGDVWVEGIKPIDVYNYLKEQHPDKYGFGLYDSFVHTDSRSIKARWDNRT